MDGFLPENLTGEEIDGFLFKEQLGEGGFAITYKAFQKSVKRDVVIKVLWSHKASIKKIVKRFHKEAQVLANFKHPNIVQVQDVRKYSNLHFMILEYIDGKPLTELLENAPLSFKRILKIVKGICDGLDYAHSKQVIHRDLKPDNILTTSDDTPMIIDFGIAKTMEGETLTIANEVFGTPKYMSPEQCKSAKDLDYRSDLYSLGVILYEMYTGEVPFYADNLLLLIYKHIHNSPPPLVEKNPQISNEIEKVVLKCLAKKPEDRYQSANEIYEALKEATFPKLLIEEVQPKSNEIDKSSKKEKSQITEIAVIETPESEEMQNEKEAIAIIEKLELFNKKNIHLFRRKWLISLGLGIIFLIAGATLNTNIILLVIGGFCVLVGTIIGAVELVNDVAYDCKTIPKYRYVLHSILILLLFIISGVIGLIIKNETMADIGFASAWMILIGIVAVSYFFLIFPYKFRRLIYSVFIITILAFLNFNLGIILNIDFIKNIGIVLGVVQCIVSGIYFHKASNYYDTIKKKIELSSIKQK